MIFLIPSLNYRSTLERPWDFGTLRSYGLSDTGSGKTKIILIHQTQKMASDVRFGSIFTRELFTDFFSVCGDVLDIAAGDNIHRRQNPGECRRRHVVDLAAFNLFMKGKPTKFSHLFLKLTLPASLFRKFHIFLHWTPPPLPSFLIEENTARDTLELLKHNG